MALLKTVLALAAVATLAAALPGPRGGPRPPFRPPFSDGMGPGLPLPLGTHIDPFSGDIVPNNVDVAFTSTTVVITKTAPASTVSVTATVLTTTSMASQVTEVSTASSTSVSKGWTIVDPFLATAVATGTAVPWTNPDWDPDHFDYGDNEEMKQYMEELDQWIEEVYGENSTVTAGGFPLPKSTTTTSLAATSLAARSATTMVTEVVKPEETESAAPVGAADVENIQCLG